jgi:hypothetical protein
MQKKQIWPRLLQRDGDVFVDVEEKIGGLVEREDIYAARQVKRTASAVPFDSVHTRRGASCRRCRNKATECYRDHAEGFDVSAPDDEPTVTRVENDLAQGACG